MDIECLSHNFVMNIASVIVFFWLRLCQRGLQDWFQIKEAAVCDSTKFFLDIKSEEKRNNPVTSLVRLSSLLL